MPERKERGADAAAYVEGAADGLADGLETEDIGGPVHEVAARTDEAFAAHPSPRSERLRARLRQLDAKVDHAIDRTRVKARAVAETARRARDVPAVVAADLKAAGQAWAGGLGAKVGFYAAAAIVALGAVILLTVALVQGLNDAIGRPWGTVIVGALYAVAAFLLMGAGKGKAEAGKREAQQRLAHAKEEIRRAGRPMRRAFTRQERLPVDGIETPIATDALAEAHDELEGGEVEEPRGRSSGVHRPAPSLSPGGSSATEQRPGPPPEWRI